MTAIQLKAQKRTITGRKVKKLRKEGIVPGNIFGKKVTSQAVSVNLIDFSKVYKKAGETQIVELLLDKETRPVLIKNVQMNPLLGKPIHADFFQVNLKEKIKAKVPVVLSGNAPAVVQKIGLLLQTLNEVEAEALPTDLPEKLTLDVSTLAQLDQELKVADIKKIPGVEILSDKNLTVVKVGTLVSKEAEALAKEEEAAAAQAKAAAAAAPEATAIPGAETPEKSAEPAKAAPADLPAGKAGAAAAKPATEKPTK
ncbi:50S ribosomal protein L25 [Candidatus Gottesmanbacteria bacterium]|nr:50S ribosomal protein L25 [Candidatus Gottesmanbacteria bacterium]